MSEWQHFPLSELTIPGRGISYGIVQPGTHEDDGVPILRVADIRGGRINVSQPMRVSSEIEAAHARTRLRGGELLLTLVGTVGEVAIVPPELAGWNVARAVAVIPIREDVGAYWVKLALSAPSVREMIHGRLNTTVQATLNLKDVAQLPILMPDSAERESIAAIIGALDDKIELNRRMNETLEAMARAIFKSWFVDFDPVRAKASGDPPESICRRLGLTPDVLALFPDGFQDSKLGEIPEGWSDSAIGALADVAGGGTPNTKEPDFWTGGQHYWATPKDLSKLSTPVLLGTERKVTDKGLAQIGSGLLPRGTVLLSSRAPIGYRAIAEVPIAVNQGFIAMLPRAGVSRYFLLYWAEWAHDEIVSRANGSTFLEISKGSFRPIPVAIPPENIFAAFDAVIGPIYERMVSSERESVLLTDERDTLLPQLLSGNIMAPAMEVGS